MNILSDTLISRDLSVYNDTISYMLVSKTHNQGIKALQFMVPLKQID